MQKTINKVDIQTYKLNNSKFMDPLLPFGKQKRLNKQFNSTNDYDHPAATRLDLSGARECYADLYIML